MAVSALVLGAGSRGRAYSDYALNHPDELVIAAVAEPDKERRESFVKTYHPSLVFNSWQEALSQERLADCVFICTLDELHTAPCLKALELGYAVLLEKPMSNNEAECRAIAKAAEGRILSVCHVLRYTPFYRTIRRVIEEGRLGEIAVIDQIENVAFWHQAHSFVRGNWRSSRETSPMILQKSCHDLDIILYLMGKRCTRISSFGSLRYFRAENAPEGAPERCLDGCPHKDECPYYAPRLYLTDDIGWPTDTISADLSLEGRRKALETGPYGRCVFHCDNDVVDRQVVNMEFEGGAVASFTMTAFSTDHTRELKVMGTKGQLTARMDRNLIVYTDFLTQTEEVIPVPEPDVEGSFGHGGGDTLIVKEFLEAVRGGAVGTTAEESLQSHLMCFAAECSRFEGGSSQEIR